MIVAFLLMSAILMMSIQTSMATEKDIMSNDVIKQAFDNNVNKISCIPETIETIEVYDSRLDEKEIIKSALKIANITGVGAYSNYGFGHYYIVDENVIEKGCEDAGF